MGLIIKTIIKKPERMGSFIFKKLMERFPASFADKFDPITSKRAGYSDPFAQGIKRTGLSANYSGYILDLGTGTGFAAYKIASAFPNAQIVGVDQAEEMLKIAIAKKEQNLVQNVSFMLGNAYKLPFNAASFDLVTVSNAPFDFKEIVHVLKKDGLFLFSLSMAGRAIVANADGITELLARHGLELIAIEQVFDGAFVLSVLK